MDELYPTSGYSFNPLTPYYFAVGGLMMFFMSFLSAIYHPVYGTFTGWFSASIVLFILSMLSQIALFRQEL
jgi:hypothetical protein